MAHHDHVSPGYDTDGSHITQKVEKEPFLKVQQLSKGFGGIHALKGVDIEFREGEIHGLIGANGAGKSTLIRHLAGVFQPDTGTITIDGQQVTIRDTQHASQLGLSFIHQELNLVPKFSALQNMLLGLPKSSHFGFIDWKASHQEANQVAKRLNIQFSLDIPVEELTVAEQWLVSIARALICKARLIAMDEPTASLSVEEANQLFKLIKDLAADGIAILYVSHRLYEIIELCDRVTVFKDGERVKEFQRAEITKSALVQAIVGGEIKGLARPSYQRTTEHVMLEVQHLHRAPRVHDVSFQLHDGEVLGLAGLVGAGRTEVARLIFGADKLEAGEILLDGQPLRIHGPQDAVKRGIGLVPEERRAQGILLDKSVWFNMYLSAFKVMRETAWLPVINRQKGIARAKKVAERLRIKTENMDTPLRQLSGGNQQKVVIGKWLIRNIHLLILDEPSRGVDVGARVEIYDAIKELANNGIPTLVISSESEELVSLCDRVLVMVEGRISGELCGNDITEEAILRLSYAHESNGEDK